jgi:hypothetical protein
LALYILTCSDIGNNPWPFGTPPQIGSLGIAFGIFSDEEHHHTPNTAVATDPCDDKENMDPQYYIEINTSDIIRGEETTKNLIGYLSRADLSTSDHSPADLTCSDLCRAFYSHIPDLSKRPSPSPEILESIPLSAQRDAVRDVAPVTRKVVVSADDSGSTLTEERV